MTLYSDGANASIHAKNFYIDSAGDLTAQNVTVTGEVNATTGTFTTIGVAGTITIGSGGSIVAGDATLSETSLTIDGSASSIKLNSGAF